MSIASPNTFQALIILFFTDIVLSIHILYFLLTQPLGHVSFSYHLESVIVIIFKLIKKSSLLISQGYMVSEPCITT